MAETTFLQQFTLSKILKCSGVEGWCWASAPEWVYGHINIWNIGQRTGQKGLLL